jgi:hypothetical protein
LTEALVSHAIDEGVTAIQMDDGRRNAPGPALFDRLMGAIDGEEQENAAILISGRRLRTRGPTSSG